MVPFGTVPDRQKLDHYRDLGIDEVVLRVPSGSGDEMLAVLDRHAGYLDGSGATDD